jgi:hypothetical protein
MPDARDSDLAACWLLCYIASPSGLTAALLLCLWLCYRQWEHQQKP